MAYSNSDKAIMDLVSICVPTYNGAEFLDECLDSASNQTYPKIEILVVDDCSSDETVPVARKHSQIDARVRVLKNDHNLGLVGNWNRCIQVARGEWIKFLFQDDLLSAQCVEKLLSEGIKRDKLLVGCDRDFIFDASISKEMTAAYRHNRDVVNAFLGANRGASAEEYATRITRRINYNYFGEPTVALIRRAAFARYGEFCPELAQICDVEFWARVGGQSGLAYVPETLATFRAHGAGTSAVNRKGKGFVASGLDPLIMLTRLLHDPVYEELRGHWRKHDLMNVVERKASDLANEVREYVGANGNLPFGGHTIGFEYERFLARHPECRVRTLEHWVWLAHAVPLRWKYQLGQRLNPVLPRRLRREKSLPF